MKVPAFTLAILSAFAVAQESSSSSNIAPSPVGPATSSTLLPTPPIPTSIPLSPSLPLSSSFPAPIPSSGSVTTTIATTNSGSGTSSATVPVSSGSTDTTGTTSNTASQTSSTNTGAALSNKVDLGLGGLLNSVLIVGGGAMLGALVV